MSARRNPYGPRVKAIKLIEHGGDRWSLHEAFDAALPSWSGLCLAWVKSELAAGRLVEVEKLDGTRIIDVAQHQPDVISE